MGAIKLKKRDLIYLESLKKSGSESSREFNRISVLLLLNKGKRINEIEDSLGIDRVTIWRIKNKYLEYGVENALKEESRPGQPVKFGVDQQAELAAVACGPCPEGRRRWTLRLLTEELRKKEGFKSISRESVRLILKKTNVSLG